MKYYLGLFVTCAIAVSANAAEGDGKNLTQEQQQHRSAIFEKYDADSDGVLTKKELKGVSKDEKKLLARTGGVGTARKTGQADKTGKAANQTDPKKSSKGSEIRSEKSKSRK